MYTIEGNAGTIAATGTPALLTLLAVPICPKRFGRHCSGQPGLLNRRYGRTNILYVACNIRWVCSASCSESPPTTTSEGLPSPSRRHVLYNQYVCRHYPGQRHYWDYLWRVPVARSDLTSTIESSGTIQPALLPAPPPDCTSTLKTSTRSSLSSSYQTLFSNFREGDLLRPMYSDKKKKTLRVSAAFSSVYKRCERAARRLRIIPLAPPNDPLAFYQLAVLRKMILSSPNQSAIMPESAIDRHFCCCRQHV